MKNIRRIAVIKGIHIGDAILAIPLLRNVKKAYPNSEIDIITEKCPVDIGEKILRNSSYISNVISIPENMIKALPVILKLGLKNYDIIIDGFPSTKNTALLSFLIGSGKNIGYTSKTLKNSLGYLYSKSIETDGRYVVDIDSDILKILGIDVEEKDKKLEISLDLKKYEEKIDSIIKDDKFIIGVHLGKNAPTRAWLHEKWADVLDYMQKKYKAKIVFIGGDQDIENTETVLSLMKKKPVNLVDKLSIYETWALMKKFDMFLCVNGGPVHMASVFKIPTICITICTLFEWDPYNEKAVVIRGDFCKEPYNFPNCGQDCNNCAGSITDAMVKKEIDKLYRKYIK